MSHEAAVAEYLRLPQHDTPVCPECDDKVVMMRGDLCECRTCRYRWRWVLAMELD